MKRSRSSSDSTTTACHGSSSNNNNTNHHPERPIQLLLHAPDGIVPYLTPILLHQYFPAPQPHLVLGISVQDTCLTPLYATTTTTTINAQQQQQQRDEDATSTTASTSTTTTAHNNDSNKTNNNNNSTNDRIAKKPCGYQFVTQPSPDYLKPYQSVLVPSFDLFQDARNNNNKRGSHQPDQDTVQASDRGVSVWSTHGRQWLYNETYLQIVRESSTSSLAATAAAPASAPRAVVSLYDQVVPHRSSNPNNQMRRQRRHEQASNRNDAWLQQLVQQQESMSSCSPSIWAAVLLREESLLSVPTEDPRIAGYAIVGWEHCHDETEQRERELIIQSLQPRECPSTTPASSQDRKTIAKTIAVLSVTSLQSIVDCLELGVVDVIGTNLPTTWSLAHRAFVLPLEYRTTVHAKRPNMTEATDSCSDDGTGSDGRSVLLDLSDTTHAKDASPLVSGCPCITCQHYSRAYIHHLHQAKELLAQILLMGHNLHHLLEFCRVATQARADDDMDAFVRHCKRILLDKQ